MAGFKTLTTQEAAARVGVTVERFRRLADRYNVFPITSARGNAPATYLSRDITEMKKQFAKNPPRAGRPPRREEITENPLEVSLLHR